MAGSSCAATAGPGPLVGGAKKAVNNMSVESIGTSRHLITSMMPDGYKGSSTRKARGVPPGTWAGFLIVYWSPRASTSSFGYNRRGLMVPRRRRLRLAGFPPTVPAMPIHAHLADLAGVRLTEDRAPRLHPLAAAAAAEGALDLGREPGTRREDLTRGETDL